MTLPTIDVNGFVQRLLSLLPRAWFSDEAMAAGGNLYAVLYGAASILVQHLAQLQYLLPQTRIATATDTNLEAIANDYFGVGQFPRIVTVSGSTYIPESDSSYSLRIRQAIAAEQNTLDAISDVVESYVTNVYGLMTSQGVNLDNDTQGGIDTYGFMDSAQATLLARGVPTVYVFDIQSDLAMSTTVGLQPGQFCILITFASTLGPEGFFLNHAYLNRGQYLLPVAIRGGPLTPQLGNTVNATKALGFQPVWMYGLGV